jgi:anti-sigma regulatory factor (Ser/Thr protein kinase)
MIIEPTEDLGWVGLDEPSAIGAARRAAESAADRLGLPAARIPEVGLAVTEIATNVHRHGGGGAVLLRAVRSGAAPELEVLAIDSGPGMADVARSSRDGHSTGGTLGIGMGAISRLADLVEISSAPGRGTVVVARFAARSGTPVPGASAGITRPLSGETMCGDAYAVRWAGARALLLVCDGSGHGPLAAAAARQAVDRFRDGAGGTDPAETVRGIHGALSGTRGAAVAVAEMDRDRGSVRYSGVGNIAGAVVSPAGKQSMVSIGGIAGYRTPTVRTFEYELPDDAVVVMHSDGLRSTWGVPNVAAVLARSALLIAGTVFRDAALRQDDACVLVSRGVA